VRDTTGVGGLQPCRGAPLQFEMKVRFHARRLDRLRPGLHGRCTSIVA
jgi:hypothetical protein